MTLEELEALIDDELEAQNSVQHGTQYIRSDDAGVAVANMNIVVTQLARRILDKQAPSQYYMQVLENLREARNNALREGV